MRKILFRGKQIDNGEWVVGYYVQKQDPLLVGVTYHHILTQEKDNCGCLMSTVSWYKVIPETVGQYTGLTDKNGKKIFEGDIVAVYVKGCRTICTVSWAETVAHFQLWQINTIPGTPTALNLGNYDCEVIGNIYDNPELLKGGEG